MIKEQIILRARIAFLFVVFFVLIIIVRLLQLQFVQRPKWERMASSMCLEYRPLKATRGNILAEDGNVLATTLPFYRVAIDPSFANEIVFKNNVEALSTCLAGLYKDKSSVTYYKNIYNARKAHQRYLVLNKQYIGHSQKKTINQCCAICNNGFAKALIFEKTEKRFNPFKDLASRTIGFVNENGKGAGLEYSFNELLKGTDGSALYTKTVGGNWKMVHTELVNKPINGYDIETTIDINLQEAAHSSLLKALQLSKASYGCVVVMAVKTGEIKAMVNLSQVNENKYSELYNYVIGDQGTREPGSTFKLASMIAVLEETDMDISKTIDTGNGIIQYYDCILRDVKKGGFGVITVQEAFEVSSNVGISKIVQETFGENPEKFVKYLNKLNLSKKLGFHMIGEGTPYIPSPSDKKNWTGITLPWMSIGYGVKVSPLQIITLFNAVANNGVMIQPIIVKRIKHSNTCIKTFNTIVLNSKICSDRTLKKLKTMLIGVAERGSASKFKGSFYEFFGKSGTANVHSNGTYSKDTYVSFVCSFPKELPEYTCMVILDKPQNYEWHFGGSLAGIVKEIAGKLASSDLNCLGYITSNNTEAVDLPFFKIGNTNELIYLCKNLNIPYKSPQVSCEWARQTVTSNKIMFIPSNQFQAETIIPNVLGMTLKDAIYILENCNLKVIVEGNRAGKVTKQSIQPGTWLEAKSTICITMR